MTNMSALDIRSSTAWRRYPKEPVTQGMAWCFGPS